MKKLDKKVLVIKNADTEQELKESGERLIANKGNFMSLADVLKLEAEKQLVTVRPK